MFALPPGMTEEAAGILLPIIMLTNVAHSKGTSVPAWTSYCFRPFLRWAGSLFIIITKTPRLGEAGC